MDPGGETIQSFVLYLEYDDEFPEGRYRFSKYGMMKYFTASPLPPLFHPSQNTLRF